MTTLTIGVMIFTLVNNYDKGTNLKYCCYSVNDVKSVNLYFKIPTRIVISLYDVVFYFHLLTQNYMMVDTVVKF